MNDVLPPHPPILHRSTTDAYVWLTPWLPVEGLDRIVVSVEQTAMDSNFTPKLAWESACAEAKER